MDDEKKRRLKQLEKKFKGRVNIELESDIQAHHKKLMALRAEQIDKAIVTVLYQEIKWHHAIRLRLFPSSVRRWVVINDQPDKNRFAVVMYGKEHWFEYKGIYPQQPNKTESDETK